MVEVWEKVTAVVKSANQPIPFALYDLADRAVVGASERKWTR